jgi:hypothetical protein
MPLIIATQSPQAEGGHSASTILFHEVFATEHPFFERSREEYEVQQLKNILQILGLRAFLREWVSDCAVADL